MRQNILNFRLTIFDYISYFTGFKFWKQFTVFFCVLVCIVFNNPDYQRFKNVDSVNSAFKDYRHNWQSLNDQILHPLTPQKHLQGSHQSKRAFRLLPAIIGKIVPIEGMVAKMMWLFTIQHLFGFLCFYFLLEIVLYSTGDRVYAFLCTIGFSFIYFGNSFFWDIYGWFDGIAYFMLVLSLYFISTSNLIPAFLTMSAAFWTDERAILISPVVLFWVLLNQKESKEIDIRKVSLNPFMIWYGLCIFTYLVSRMYLTNAYALAIPLGFGALVGLKMIVINMQVMPNSLFSIYEGLWIPFILMIVWIWNQKSKVSFIVMLLFLSLSIVISFCVVDVTRSLTYTFPWILFAFVLVHRLNEKGFARTVALVAVLISVVYPNLFYLGKLTVVVSNYNQIIKYLGFS